MRLRLSLALVLVAVLSAGAIGVRERYYPSECRQYLRMEAELKDRVARQSWERPVLRGRPWSGDAWAARGAQLVKPGRGGPEWPQVLEELALAGLGSEARPGDLQGVWRVGEAWEAARQRFGGRSLDEQVDDLLDFLLLALDMIRTADLGDAEWGSWFDRTGDGVDLLVEVLHEFSARFERGDLRPALARIETALALADAAYPSRVPAREAAVLHRLMAPRFFIPPVLPTAVSSSERQRAREVAQARLWEMREIAAVRAGEEANSMDEAVDAIKRTEVLTPEVLLQETELWRQGLARIRDVRIQLQPALSRSLIDPITGTVFSACASVSTADGVRPTLPLTIPGHDASIGIDERRWRLASFGEHQVTVYGLGAEGAQAIATVRTSGRGFFDTESGLLRLGQRDWDVDRPRLVRTARAIVDPRSPQESRYRITCDYDGEGWHRRGPCKLSITDSTSGAFLAERIAPFDVRSSGISPDGRIVWLQSYRWREVPTRLLLIALKEDKERNIELADGELPVRSQFTPGDVEITTSAGRVLRLAGADTSIPLAWADRITQYLPELDAAVITNWADKQTRIVPWPK